MPNKNAPSTKFTREELLQFAQAGVRETVRGIERTIARLQREFPEVMIGGTIALLKPEPRTDGQAWPHLDVEPTRPPVKKGDGRRAAWTPARRKKQAALMRKNERGKKRGITGWQKMQAVLQAAPNHRATATEIREATGLTHAAMANSFTAHEDLFKRAEPGVYTLTAAGKKAAETNGATP